jgi:hypothetical protein
MSIDIIVWRWRRIRSAVQVSSQPPARVKRIVTGPAPGACNQRSHHSGKTDNGPNEIYLSNSRRNAYYYTVLRSYT